MKKVLIVDDESDLVEVLTIRLKQWKYEVCSALNGADAIAQLQKEQVGLILLDYFLPDTNGLELSKQLRGQPGYETIPILFISASKEKLDEIPVMEKTEKILKPIPPETLQSLVQKYLSS